MARGGYRKPANPAPVSGPGKMSRRTDGNQPVMEMAGGKYGEGKALREMQQGAPMAQSQQGMPTPSAAQQAQAPAQKMTGLFEPTQRPEEPITAGMPIGPGPNSIAGGNIYSAPSLRNTLEKALAIDNDPALEVAYNYLVSRGAI